MICSYLRNVIRSPQSVKKIGQVCRCSVTACWQRCFVSWTVCYLRSRSGNTNGILGFFSRYFQNQLKNFCIALLNKRRGANNLQNFFDGLCLHAAITLLTVSKTIAQLLTQLTLVLFTAESWVKKKKQPQRRIIMKRKKMSSVLRLIQSLNS